MEQWIREGFSNYYVVEKKQEITYEKEILLRHPIKSLLPCEFRMEDEKEYYYYETGRYERWWERKNQMEPQIFFLRYFCGTRRDRRILTEPGSSDTPKRTDVFG